MDSGSTSFFLLASSSFRRSRSSWAMRLSSSSSAISVAMAMMSLLPLYPWGLLALVHAFSSHSRCSRSTSPLSNTASRGGRRVGSQRRRSAPDSLPLF